MTDSAHVADQNFQIKRPKLDIRSKDHEKPGESKAPMQNGHNGAKLENGSNHSEDFESYNERSEQPTTSETSSAHENGKKLLNKERFRYGNYNQYYGTRLNGKFERDPRLELMPKEWFKNRAVLDVGCNVGYLTLSIAKELEPNRILGVDVDGNLIGIARKNIRHYCGDDTELVGKFPAALAEKKTGKVFASELIDRTFPKNIWFRQENYVLDSDDLLDMVKEEFHVILALSITKWIHLNWGDDGIKRFFKRACRHLLPGGRFILESQEFSSYRKRSKLAADMEQNYRSIKFKPQDFSAFLLSSEVGFEKVEELGVPKAKSKGFERPLLVYTKRKYKSKSTNQSKDLIT
ncbi:bicoid-interacting protein 3 (Bin3) domain-containing protein [Ditylenchus destructor]|nr:bicoid-interacting protein 3 (Bin3) domain-containing protein [Ditylenchus destructor]